MARKFTTAARVKPGQKICITREDSVVMGWVTEVRQRGTVTTELLLARKKRLGTNGETLLGSGHIRTVVDVLTEVEILIDVRPEVGDLIGWNEVFDLPIGSAVVRNDRQGPEIANRFTWMVQNLGMYGVAGVKYTKILVNKGVPGRFHAEPDSGNTFRYKILYIAAED